MAAVIGIVAKVSHPEASTLTSSLIQWLNNRSIEFLVESDTAVGLDLQSVSTEMRVARENLSNRCSLIVSLGGDGTLISVCRHPSPTPTTIIGVNLGTLGFLTEITPDELFIALEKVLQNEATVEARYLFECSVHRDAHQSIASFHALNDVVITKQALARVFALEVQINKQRAAIVRGDGVILATPAGSTAYSLAAGGSIVHPEVQALLMTPICPHSLTSRPLVLPSSAEVQLRLASETSGKEVYLTIDGQEGMALTSKDTVAVRVSKHHILVATSPTRSYFEVLNSKLKWAPS